MRKGVVTKVIEKKQKWLLLAGHVLQGPSGDCALTTLKGKWMLKAQKSHANVD